MSKNLAKVEHGFLLFNNEFTEIDNLVDEGDFEAALFMLDEMAVEHPGSLEITLKKIEVCRTVGLHNKDTLLTIEKLHSENPENIDFWLMLVAELANLSLFALAEKEIELILSSAEGFVPDSDTEAFLSSIKEISSQEREYTFADSYKLQIVSDLAEKCVLVDELTKAVSFAEDLLKQAPDNTKIKLRAARIIYSSGNFTKSAKIAEQILAKEPENGEALEVMALSSRMIGQPVPPYESAEKKLLDDEVGGLSGQIMYLLLSGKEEVVSKLYKKFEETIQSHPDASDFLEALAFIEYKNGNREAAISHWQRAALLAPDASVVAHLNLVTIEEGEENADAGFYLLGTQYFPALFSKLIKKIAVDSPSDPFISSDLENLTGGEIRALRNACKLAMEYGDSTLVRCSTELFLEVSLDHPEEKGDTQDVLIELDKLITGRRLSPFIKMGLLRMSRDYGELLDIREIFFNDKFIPVPFFEIESDDFDIEDILDELLAECLEEESLDDFEPSEIDDDMDYDMDDDMDDDMEDDMEDLEEESHGLMATNELIRGDFEKAKEFGALAFDADSEDAYTEIDYLRTLKILGQFEELEAKLKLLKQNHEENVALRALEIEFNLPKSSAKAREFLSEIDEAISFTPQEFRECQLLRAAMMFQDGLKAEAEQELDLLELYIPECGQIVRERKLTNA